MRNELRVGMAYASGWPMGLPGRVFFDGSVNFYGLDEFEESLLAKVSDHIPKLPFPRLVGEPV